MVSHGHLLLDLRVAAVLLLLWWRWRLSFDSVLDLVLVLIVHSMTSDVADVVDVVVWQERCEVDGRGHLQLSQLGLLLML